jgi:plasmid stabilization system protein ParE
MGDWRVTPSEQAETDLQAAVEFLAHSSISAAARVGSELADTIFSLDALPVAVRQSKPALDCGVFIIATSSSTIASTSRTESWGSFASGTDAGTLGI